MGMVHHRAVDLVRREEAHRRRAEAAIPEALEEQADHADAVIDEARSSGLRRTVQAALADLPPEQREVLEMMYFDGLMIPDRGDDRDPARNGEVAHAAGSDAPGMARWRGSNDDARPFPDRGAHGRGSPRRAGRRGPRPARARARGARRLRGVPGHRGRLRGDGRATGIRALAAAGRRLDRRRDRERAARPARCRTADELAGRRERPGRGWRTLATAAAVVAVLLLALATLRPSTTGVTEASPTQRFVTFSGEEKERSRWPTRPGGPAPCSEDAISPIPAQTWCTRSG